MIKKLDKFILSRFIGPFFLAYAVVTFIFLIQHLIRYFKHFVGKDLGFMVFMELFSHFALMLTPVTLPLAVLLSSLMSFGSLGEHSELTAIKSSGISLLRVLLPVALFVVFLTFGAVYFNDVISPEANLKAYSLLYDIKQKKPTLEFKDGAFYDGLPGYSIRVEKKSGIDGQELEGLMIYDHTARQGNTSLIVAERGRMYTINDGSYLILEMINGKGYNDLSAERGRITEEEFLENEFDSSKIVFDMASFGMKETKKELFQGHNMMKTASQLMSERDSTGELLAEAVDNLSPKTKSYYLYQFAKDKQEELERAKSNISDSIPPRSTRPRHEMPKSADTTANKPQKKHNIRDLIDFSKPKNTNELQKYIDQKGTAPPAVEELNDEALAQADSTSKVIKAKLSNIKRNNSPSNDSLPNQRLSNTGQMQSLPPTRSTKRATKQPIVNMRELRIQKERQKQLNEKNIQVKKDSLKEDASIRENKSYRVLNLAWSKANGIKISAEDTQRKVERHSTEMKNQWIEYNNRYSRSLAVFAMFLIGAPLGAIIKKGGLGIPILISILFFLIYYITTIIGTNLALTNTLPAAIACWLADILLLSCGAFFLKQAYQDSRLFDFDYYAVAIDKLKSWLSKKKA